MSAGQPATLLRAAMFDVYPSMSPGNDPALNLISLSSPLLGSETLTLTDCSVNRARIVSIAAMMPSGKS
jgi:hypothetical protein